MNLGEALALIAIATLMAIFWDFFGTLNAFMFGAFAIVVMCLFQLIRIQRILEEWKNQNE